MKRIAQKEDKLELHHDELENLMNEITPEGRKIFLDMATKALSQNHCEFIKMWLEKVDPTCPIDLLIVSIASNSIYKISDNIIKEQTEMNCYSYELAYSNAIRVLRKIADDMEKAPGYHNREDVAH